MYIQPYNLRNRKKKPDKFKKTIFLKDLRQFKRKKKKLKSKKKKKTEKTNNFC